MIDYAYEWTVTCKSSKKDVNWLYLMQSFLHLCEFLCAICVCVWVCISICTCRCRNDVMRWTSGTHRILCCIDVLMYTAIIYIGIPHCHQYHQHRYQCHLRRHHCHHHHRQDCGCGCGCCCYCYFCYSWLPNSKWKHRPIQKRTDERQRGEPSDLSESNAFYYIEILWRPTTMLKNMLHERALLCDAHV